MKHIIKILIIFVLLGVSFSPLARAQYFFFENEHIGKRAPDFTLTKLSGGEFNLHKEIKGSNAILFFWATWCPHCRKQLRELNDQRNVYKEKGIKIVLIDSGEDARIIKKYIEKNKIRMDVVLDRDSELSEIYGLVGLPTFFLVDKNGNVLDSVHVIPHEIDKIFQ